MLDTIIDATAPLQYLLATQLLDCNSYPRLAAANHVSESCEKD